MPITVSTANQVRKSRNSSQATLPTKLMRLLESHQREVEYVQTADSVDPEDLGRTFEALKRDLLKLTKVA